MRVLSVLLILVATPAMANEACHDLWFTRNLIMDRAGYCFGSTLGKAVFDNSDCTGKSVTLGENWQQQVSRLRARETQLECKVDTSRPFLDLPDADIRRRLNTLPVRDEFESACIGWLKSDLSLHASTHAASTVVGVVSPGDNVSFRHDAVGEWNYVTVTGKDWGYKSAGWTDSAFAIGDCAQFAG